MKKFLKIFSLVLAVAMLVTTFAGCGKNTTKENTSAEETKPRDPKAIELEEKFNALSGPEDEYADIHEFVDAYGKYCDFCSEVRTVVCGNITNEDIYEVYEKVFSVHKDWKTSATEITENLKNSEMSSDFDTLIFLKDYQIQSYYNEVKHDRNEYMAEEIINSSSENREAYEKRKYPRSYNNRDADSIRSELHSELYSECKWTNYSIRDDGTEYLTKFEKFADAYIKCAEAVAKYPKHEGLYDLFYLENGFVEDRYFWEASVLYLGNYGSESLAYNFEKDKAELDKKMDKAFKKAQKAVDEIQ